METEGIVKAVLDFLEKTGTALVTTGFPIAVRYVIAQGITQVFGGLFSFGVFGICARNLYKLAAGADSKVLDDESSGFFVKVVINVILGIFFLVAAFGSQILEGIRMLISPEWFAILNIIDLVK